MCMFIAHCCFETNKPIILISAIKIRWTLENEGLESIPVTFPPQTCSSWYSLLLIRQSQEDCLDLVFNFTMNSIGIYVARPWSLQLYELRVYYREPCGFRWGFIRSEVLSAFEFVNVLPIEDYPKRSKVQFQSQAFPGKRRKFQIFGQKHFCRFFSFHQLSLFSTTAAELLSPGICRKLNYLSIRNEFTAKTWLGRNAKPKVRFKNSDKPVKAFLRKLWRDKAAEPCQWIKLF